MNEPVNLLSVWKLEPEHISRIESVSPRIHFRFAAESQMDSHLADIEVLMTRNLAVDLKKAPRLKWIQMMGAGADRLDYKILMERNIRVTNASGIHAVPIAEYVFAFMLAFSYRLPVIFAWQGRRHWPKDARTLLGGSELRGKTILIFGYGSIGREVGRLAHAFGMRVLALKHSPDQRDDKGYCLPGVGDPKGEIPERIFGPSHLLEVLPECDFVVLTTPLTPETEGMIDERALRAMKPTACLINMARGKVVDEKALIRALKDKRIAGAGLDVFSQEPLPEDSPLYDLENVIISPHNAGNSPAYNERLTDVFVENLERYLAGKPLLNLIDLKKKY